MVKNKSIIEIKQSVSRTITKTRARLCNPKEGRGGGGGVGSAGGRRGGRERGESEPTQRKKSVYPFSSSHRTVEGRVK